ncbi:MAG TPA: hypothetical protein VFH58_16885 [Acidimicrobiales bacterium]|nr:hypothetical protein [Acidimicrobiales bacterium]
MGLVAIGLIVLLSGALTQRPRSTAASTGVVAAAIPTTAAPPTTLPPPPPTTAATTTTTTTTTTTVPPTTAPAPTTAGAIQPAALAGCPVPPHPPLPAGPPPWHPAVLVPDSSLPPVVAPAAWRSDLDPIRGSGMWIWQWDRTDGGDAAAVVKQATGAHLHQLWVRVGDSKDGFYGAAELKQLVPVAHRAGLTVIAWGFPYLYDPVGDANWTAQVLAWRGPAGEAVDGFSADIERPSEGVALSARRAAVYLENVRRAAGARPVIATVYPPIDSYWSGGGYPFAAMAPYVDAFAPMIYWECTDPAADARFDVARLATLRPVHIIGQAFNMADIGGRAPAPSAAEISEFLQAGKQAGAVGASFWVWQDATPEEWGAIARFGW